MNERIKELTDQCYEYKAEMQDIWFDKEKFAELIIRECRYIVAENFHECQTASKMDSIIKKNFGIE